MTKASISFVILILLAACEKQIEKPKPIDRSVLEQYLTGVIDLDSSSPTSLHGKYEHSNIVAAHYDLTDLPDESVLVNDLSTFLELYEKP